MADVTTNTNTSFTQSGVTQSTVCTVQSAQELPSNSSSSSNTATYTTTISLPDYEKNRFMLAMGSLVVRYTL